MSDINPQAWIEGFRKDHPKVRKSAAPQADMAGLIGEGRIIVTARLAQQILLNCHYPRQRRVEQTHVAALAEQMRRGQFLGGTQIAFGRLGGNLYVVNGQHRLAAVVEASVSVEFQVLVIDCADDHALDAAYYRFDVVQRHRSKEMVIRASDVCERQQVRATVAKGAYEAGIIIECGLRRIVGQKLPPYLKTPDGKLEAAEPFWQQVREYQGLIENADAAVRRRLLNGSVMAVAILTLRDQKEKAEGFWRGVAENDGLHVGDPRRTLMLALSSRDLRTMDTALLFCASAWNAWFSGKSLTLLKALPGSEPKLRGVKMPT